MDHADRGGGATRYWTGSRLLIAAVMVVGILGPTGVWVAHRLSRQGPQSAGLVRVAPVPELNLEGLTLPGEEVRRGAGMDAIPSLTTADAIADEDRQPHLHGAHPPEIVPVQSEDLLADERRVVGVTIGGQSRAYPIKLLNYHECVNDVVGGVPIAVIYCPLCDSVSVIDRRIGDQTIEFGISGLLYNSNVLLYDRTDRALWSQVLMQAVSGPHAGERLKHLTGWDIMPFARWRDLHPEATVMTYRSGHRRPYEPGPYADYFENDAFMFPVKTSDDRIKRKKTPVIGVLSGDDARAYPVAAIAASPGGVVREQWGGGEVVLRADADGAVRVQAVPEGASAVHSFWHAWVGMYPGTEIYPSP